MQLKTILNRVQKHRSFVYRAAHLREERGRVTLDVELRPRSNARPICSGCSRSRPGYDTLAPRRFEFVSLWGIAVFFVYAMRRVDCPRCGVVVESVPWGSGKHQTTATYAWFLARWAKRMSWSEVAERGVRIPHLQSDGNRLVSRPRTPSRARSHPQILLTRQRFQDQQEHRSAGGRHRRPTPRGYSAASGMRSVCPYAGSQR